MVHLAQKPIWDQASPSANRLNRSLKATGASRSVHLSQRLQLSTERASLAESLHRKNLYKTTACLDNLNNLNLLNLPSQALVKLHQRPRPSRRLSHSEVKHPPHLRVRSPPSALVKQRTTQLLLHRDLALRRLRPTMSNLKLLPSALDSLLPRHRIHRFPLDSLLPPLRTKAETPRSDRPARPLRSLSDSHSQHLPRTMHLAALVRHQHMKPNQRALCLEIRRATCNNQRQQLTPAQRLSRVTPSPDYLRKTRTLHKRVLQPQPSVLVHLDPKHNLHQINQGGLLCLSNRLVFPSGRTLLTRR